MLIQLTDLIKKYNMQITGVIHVGAHTFEEMKIYDALGLKQYWIEANPELCKNFTNTDTKKLFNFAASDKPGTADFYVTNNMASSSLLKLKKHLQHHPKIYEKEIISVPLNTIDSLHITDAQLLNLDIQGAELNALKGAVHTLQYINYVYTEVNTAELYEGCCLINDIDKFLKTHGFVRSETELTPYEWGDALYIRF